MGCCYHWKYHSEPEHESGRDPVNDPRLRNELVIFHIGAVLLSSVDPTCKTEQL